MIQLSNRISKIFPKLTWLILILAVLITPIATALASNFGYVYVWSAAPALLTAVVACLTLVRVGIDPVLRQKMISDRVCQLILIFVTLNIVYLFVGSNVEMAIVGAVFDTRFLVLFLCTYILGQTETVYLEPTVRLIIYISLLVSFLAIVLVFALPSDALTHIGYDAFGSNTSGIPPAYHVLGDSQVVRAQSVLRGPNALGAFLLLPIALMTFSLPKTRIRIRYVAGLVLMLFTLFLTFSRSAWLGLAAMAGILGILYLPKARFKSLRIPVAFVILIVVIVALNFGKNFELIYNHGSKDHRLNSTSEHIRATKNAIRDVQEHPLGHGLGTAGPVSAIATDQSPKIAENYYLQVFQELGWLGGVLFILINGLVIIRLWRVRNQPYVLPIMLAGIGLICTNFFLHTWADEAVSMTWWAIAGTALTPVILNKKRKA